MNSSEKYEKVGTASLGTDYQLIQSRCVLVIGLYKKRHWLNLKSPFIVNICNETATFNGKTNSSGIWVQSAATLRYLNWQIRGERPSNGKKEKNCCGLGTGRLYQIVSISMLSAYLICGKKRRKDKTVPGTDSEVTRSKLIFTSKEHCLKWLFETLEDSWPSWFYFLIHLKPISGSNGT